MVSDEDIDKAIKDFKEQRKANSVDDKFAKGLGYPNLEELKESLTIDEK